MTLHTLGMGQMGVAAQEVEGVMKKLLRQLNTTGRVNMISILPVDRSRDGLNGS